MAETTMESIISSEITKIRDRVEEHSKTRADQFGQLQEKLATLSNAFKDIKEHPALTSVPALAQNTWDLSQRQQASLLAMQDSVTTIKTDVSRIEATVAQRQQTSIMSVLDTLTAIKADIVRIDTTSVANRTSLQKQQKDILAFEARLLALEKNKK